MNAKERVQLEQKELEDKIDKLSTFIEFSDDYKNLSDLQQQLLKHQETAMMTYYGILATRLATWEDTND